MQASSSLSIGTIAQQTGCSVPSIRYYEEIGLLPAAARSASGQRRYGAAAVRRLAFIRRCRDFGFSIEQVRELAGLVDDAARPCAEVRGIAARHLDGVRGKLAELRALEASLAGFVAGCATACAGAAAADCCIVEDLSLGGDTSRQGLARTGHRARASASR